MLLTVRGGLIYPCERKYCSSFVFVLNFQERNKFREFYLIQDQQHRVLIRSYCSYCSYCTYCSYLLLLLRFMNVLVDMNSEERKAFLQFTTGCSSLPPGGLANLHPRLVYYTGCSSLPPGGLANLHVGQPYIAQTYRETCINQDISQIGHWFRKHDFEGHYPFFLIVFCI